MSANRTPAMPAIAKREPFPTPLDPLNAGAYYAIQQLRGGLSLAHKRATSQLKRLLAPQADQPTKPLSAAGQQQLQQRRGRLLAQDWQDAQRGVYPQSLLFEAPWPEWLRDYPTFWWDAMRAWQRIQAARHREFAPEIDTSGYPDYYLQNFHHQTDGYLSELSARLYDLQVELFFNGTADAMRRRILTPMQQALAAPQQPRRLADLACGTGRTLQFLRAAFPQAALWGMDLSRSYLRKARERLAAQPGEQPRLLAANLEALPCPSDRFHGVSCVFTLHELPAPARQRALDEACRITRPGGAFVLCDSLQLDDVPALNPMLENFPVLLHEPYYRHYIHDNIEARLAQAGFELLGTSSHFVSKYWVARKPAAA